MMGGRLVKILLLHLSSVEIMLHSELSSCMEAVGEVAIRAVQAVEVGSKERRQPGFQAKSQAKGGSFDGTVVARIVSKSQSRYIHFPIKRRFVHEGGEIFCNSFVTNFRLTIALRVVAGRS
jgi:hypothetical protein